MRKVMPQLSQDECHVPFRQQSGETSVDAVSLNRYVTTRRQSAPQMLPSTMRPVAGVLHCSGRWPTLSPALRRAHGGGPRV